MRRRLAVLTALMALTGSAWTQEMDARAILAQAGKVYSQAQDFSARGKAALNLQIFGMTQRLTVHQSIVFGRPNKLRLDSTMVGAGTRTVVSNGRHVYVSQDVTHEYTRHAAPDTVCAIRDLQSDAPDDFTVMVDVPTLLDGADLSERIQEASVERTGTYAGAPVYVLSLTLKGGHTERLWIGTEDHLVRRLEFHLNTEGMLGGAATEPEPPAGAAPEGAPPAGESKTPGDAEAGKQLGHAMADAMLQAFKLEMTWTERYEDIRLNQGVPADSFRFRPRPGERRVSKLSDIPMPQTESPAEPPSLSESPSAGLTGQAAPDFTLPDLDGKPVTLSALRGKPVLLDFWASWCGPCRMELPHVQELHQEYAERGLQVIAVSLDSVADDARNTAAQDGLTFPILWADAASPEMAQVLTAYGVESIPRLLLIDANGIIQADLTGYHEKDQLVEALAKVGL